MHGNSDLCLNTYWSIFEETLEPESHHSINEHMCKFKSKSLMRQYMKNKPIKLGFKFWFCCRSMWRYLYEFYMYLGKKGNTGFGLGELVVLSLCECLKDSSLIINSIWEDSICLIRWKIFIKLTEEANFVFTWKIFLVILILVKWIPK